MPTTTSPIIYCGSENRRNLVRTTTGPGGLPVLNGIDYLEVANVAQTELSIQFIHPLPAEANGVPDAAPALTVENISISGGDRIQEINIVSVVSNNDNLLVTVGEPGDFSMYTFSVVAGLNVETPPAGFDTQLSKIDFSFKAICPSDFDCQDIGDCDPALPESPKIDYLARDYQSFRRVLLDRMRNLMPNWLEESPADFPIVLTELLAYVGDHIAYTQDSTATEAYLGKALHRTSMRRHARLRDYHAHEGCNARTWLQMQVEPGGAADGALIELGQRFFAGSNDQVDFAIREEFGSLNPEKSVIFEAMEELEIDAAHNQFELYTWSDDECSLCQGACSATFIRVAGSNLSPNHVIIFEEVQDPRVSIDSLLRGRPDRRWPVRLTAVEEIQDPLTGLDLYRVHWNQDDALPFSFVISRRVEDILINNISVAFGNILLADYGLTVLDDANDPSLSPRQAPLVTDAAAYAPVLSETGLTHRQTLSNPSLTSATRCILQEPKLAQPQVWLDSEGERWQATSALISSDGNAADFVIEIDNHRLAHLRFGDGEHGRQPALGQNFSAVFRTGNGSRGNLGADTNFTILRPGGGFQRIRNPLAAFGGTEPESMEEIRQFAPVAFRVQERAVTLEDYQEVAMRHTGVQQARAEFRWLASWYTVFLAVDRIGGQPIDDEFRADLLNHMNNYRMTGYDLEIGEPQYVPLDIGLFICLKKGVSRTLVNHELSERLGSGPLGLFHPDRLSFGQRIYSSQIIEQVMSVAGVDSASVIRFKRFRDPAETELEDGYLEVNHMELPQLASNPSLPERGIIEFILEGGY